VVGPVLFPFSLFAVHVNYRLVLGTEKRGPLAVGEIPFRWHDSLIPSFFLVSQSLAPPVPLKHPPKMDGTASQGLTLLLSVTCLVSPVGPHPPFSPRPPRWSLPDLLTIGCSVDTTHGWGHSFGTNLCFKYLLLLPFRTLFFHYFGSVWTSCPLVGETERFFFQLQSALGCSGPVFTAVLRSQHGCLKQISTPDGLMFFLPPNCAPPSLLLSGTVPPSAVTSRWYPAF